MSPSLLYHGFGIRGYRYIRTDYREGGVVFTISQDLETCRCSVCGSRNVHPKGRIAREFRAVPIGRKPVTLALAIPRVHCCPALHRTRVFLC